MLNRRQEKSSVSKKVIDKNALKTKAQRHNFFMLQICFPKMWLGGAKIQWRGGANGMV